MYEITIDEYYCKTNTFVINGINATTDDFGELKDIGQDFDPTNYFCGNMQFEEKPWSSDVLKKYKIDEKEYYQITKRLCESLSFGQCSLCL